jgi:putative oxidoreductase
MTSWIRRAVRAAQGIDRLQPLALLALRLYVADVFFRSGLVKISNWPATLALFRDEYQVPVLSPALAAYAGAFGELVLPVLLVLGLGAAAGLFVVNLMAVVSYPQLFQFECPAGINSHIYWGSLLALLVVFGPGRLALDNLVLRRLQAA